MYTIKHTTQNATQFRAMHEAAEAAEAEKSGRYSLEGGARSMPTSASTPTPGYGSLSLLDELNSLDQTAVSFG
jgi:hypothetical protein